MTPHAYGRHAALLLFDEPAEVRPWLAALEAAPPEGVVDVVAGATSVVVVGDPHRTDAATLIHQLGSLGPHMGQIFQLGEGQGAGDVVEVPVVYDGEDLDEVARRSGLDTAAVMALHSGAVYEVAFCGFSPGFAYLTGLPEELRLPRRDTPRSRVPAGSVGIASGYSAVYPQASPGGWWLLGRTDLAVWDVERDPPALLRPGMRVRSSRCAREGGDRVIEVRAPGLSALVQDLGRVGHARHGVSPSGAADRTSHLRADALVGNAPRAATLEIVAPGFSCRFHVDTVVALTGAPTVATLDGLTVPHDSALVVRAGQTLSLGATASGLRTYLAVRGGIAVPAVLGSRATDVLSGLGPAPLRAGDTLPLGADVDEQDWRAPAPLGAPRNPLEVPLATTPGAAWVDLAALADATYAVGQASGRTALRLDGPGVPRLRQEEFPTQGLVRGAVQIPPDGRPVVFLADHPVTGGYPVVGVVPSPHTDRLAQLRPGHRLALRPT